MTRNVSALLSPVLAGIRADKPDRPTFPCTLHSGFERRSVAHHDACFTVAGAAHVGLSARVSRLTADMNMSAGTKTGVIVWIIVRHCNDAGL
jgi:hypothetical protein